MTSNPLSNNTASDVFTVSNGFDHKANNDHDNSMRHRSRPPSYSSVVKATSSPADSSGLVGAATNDTGYASSSYPAGYSAASDEHKSYSSKSRNDHLPYSAHPSADNLLPYSPNPNASHDYLPYSSSNSASPNPGSLPYSANPPHQEVYSTPVRSEILAYPDSPYNRRTESSAPPQENTNLDNHRQSGRGSAPIGFNV
jgi:hypothetical protein